MTRSRGDRGASSLDAVVVLVLVVVAGVAALGLGLGLDAEVAPPSGQAQSALTSASNGQDVRADITADGELKVTHLVTTPTPVAALQVRADQSDGRSRPAAVKDVQVTAGGATVATLLSVGPQPQPIALGPPVRQFTLTYRVDLALDRDAATVDGRALAFVPRLGVDYSGETGPIRRRVVASGEILNVACVRADGATPLPCGFTTGDGWQVYFDDEDQDLGLLVQVDLS